MRGFVLVSFLALLASIVAAEWLCPFTKVEESFGMQAMHDLLFERGVASFDHIAFPGVVPRSFAGPWAVAAAALTAYVWLLQPAASLFLPEATSSWFVQHPMAASHLCRCVLGAAVALSLAGVAAGMQRARRPPTARDSSPPQRGRRRSPRSHGRGAGATADVASSEHTRAAASGTDRRAAGVFLLLCATQFHLLFYASRALPNTFGLVAANAALGLALARHHRSAVACLAAGAAVLRCDLLVLLAPLGLELTLRARRLSLPAGVAAGLAGAAAAAAATAGGLDSALWRRLLWPEASVLLFNTVDNRSAEWGTQPWHWYAAAALPRALLAAYPLALWLALLAVAGVRAPREAGSGLLACVWDASAAVAETYRSVLLTAAAFVALYSALPHKEMRFVMVAFPWLLAPAAALLSELVTRARAAPRRRSATAAAYACVAGVLALAGAASVVSVAVSADNYPGAAALARLQRDYIAPHLQAGEGTGGDGNNTRAAPPVTAFIDAYAGMSGVNRFQKRWSAAHGAAAARVWDGRRRWRAVTTLPLRAFAAVSASPRGWPTLADRLRALRGGDGGAADDSPLLDAAAERALFSPDDAGADAVPREGAAVVYVKDPERFAAAGEAGDGAPEVYRAGGIDYAVVRAAHRELFLRPRGGGGTPEFELLFAQPNSNARAAVRHMIASALALLRGAWPPPLESRGEDFLLVLRRRRPSS